MLLTNLMQGRGSAGVGPRPESERAQGRVRVAGKFFSLDGHRWLLKGFTYGPFAPNGDGEFLPDPSRLASDFAQIRALGANCIRLYHPPTPALLDLALVHGLRVFVDVPWDKHRCFFEDWAAEEQARARVRRAATELGVHPGLFALSIANEIPSDVVRFYGYRRVGRFIEELIDVVKQASPTCPTTFANYPSTEFLRPEIGDFLFFNVYLNDGPTLGRYLDRLQHLAGSKPVILGEFGADSFRQGEGRQADMIAEHVSRVFHHGLAGSFVFSFTDDWFTGGHRIEDWAFGVTRCDRSDKPAATALRDAWLRAPRVEPAYTPRISVVICSYNGAATLRESLDSVTRLNYPDYEVILVDDGSCDDTPRIAADFPAVRTIRQENRGLGVARNVGARAATGEVIAYTDSDCIADPDWLYYLTDAMWRQGVEAIGGPNLVPPADGWTAQCVAASPGGPSHVMLDDRIAEHIPGCNMAFRRDLLLALNGFDPQFRQAGDDVDFCWRWMDAGHRIGYAPAAVVWHHRRATIRAFLRQQKGYGRSEAMLLYKHPARFNRLGCSRWFGIIYGEGAVGLPTLAPQIFHGRYGSALFQRVYRHNQYTAWAYCTLLEWHVIACALLAMSYAFRPVLIAAGAMWLATLAAAVRSTARSPLNCSAPLWCRPLVLALHVLQPIVRSYHRYLYRLSAKRLPVVPPEDLRSALPLKRISGAARDAYWASRRGRGREDLLAALETTAGEWGWRGAFHEEWQSWDVLLRGDRWHNLVVCTATEELGGPKRFTRVRCSLRPTHFSVVVSSLVAVGLAVCAAGLVRTAVVAGATVFFLLFHLLASRRRCFAAVAALLGAAGRIAGLDPFGPKASIAGRRALSSRNRGPCETAVNVIQEPALATMLSDGDTDRLGSN
jgi:glycosyltransferase involved in cell wall biosynthesis